MAVYRTIHISFWQDPFVLKLTPEEKYFYIYLMTNSKTNQLGCYEIAKAIIKLETGYNDETVDKLLERFIDYKKIKYSEDTNEMLLMNWHKYSWSKSPKVEICIKGEFDNIKNYDFKTYLYSLCIQYGYSMDSLWIKKEETKEETKTKKEEKESIPDDKSSLRASKHKYGEYQHILLKDSELQKLNDDYGELETKEAIKFLDEYIEMKGTKYKSHNLALRKWVFDAVKEKKNKKQGKQSTTDFYDDMKEWVNERDSSGVCDN